uniref:Far upstream element-binding protein 2 n=1 Tax=Globodera pallida TaxID=36090 RepID=A0A183BUR3_GLOPA
MKDSAIQQLTDPEIESALQRSKQLAASNGGQKRTFSDDLNFYPAKRKSNGTDMANVGMGAQVAETVVETVDIPESAVGLVIGRGGEQIQLIQQQSSCRVQMSGESNVSGFRQCTLQGVRQNIDKAKQLIQEVLERSNRTAPGIQNGANSITIELSVPGAKCGLIIGKNGETIKGLQEQIGVKMMLVQESHQPTMGTKPLRISGPPDKVDNAKRIIEQLLTGDGSQPNLAQTLRGGSGGGGGGGNAPRSIGEVIVPRTSVGIIIGKGGETIKRLAAETGAKIQFKPDDPNLQERCAVIQGTPEQINRATHMISELVTRSSGGGGQQETFYMHVPANKTGLVIGKGGDTIKQIGAETGAHVELSRESPPNSNEKVFVIKGTPYQIHHVQHIIRIKVGDVAPGTPLPTFHGSTGISNANTPLAVGNPYGPTTHHQQQQPFNAAPAQQDPSAWTQYYNQQQAMAIAGGPATQPASFGGTPTQHYQPMPGTIQTAVSQAAQLHPSQVQPQQIHQQQAAIAQPQQAVSAGIGAISSAAPTINPQTGQPDYSAQWADYYRTMGMHEQASLIEAQMKQNQAAAQAQRPQQQLYMQ